eukprot:gene17593-6695_t
MRNGPGSRATTATTAQGKGHKTDADIADRCPHPFASTTNTVPSPEELSGRMNTARTAVDSCNDVCCCAVCDELKHLQTMSIEDIEAPSPAKYSNVGLPDDNMLNELLEAQYDLTKHSDSAHQSWHNCMLSPSALSGGGKTINVCSDCTRALDRNKKPKLAISNGLYNKKIHLLTFSLFEKRGGAARLKDCAVSLCGSQAAAKAILNGSSDSSHSLRWSHIRTKLDRGMLQLRHSRLTNDGCRTGFAYSASKSRNSGAVVPLKAKKVLPHLTKHFAKQYRKQPQPRPRPRQQLHPRPRQQLHQPQAHPVEDADCHCNLCGRYISVNWGLVKMKQGQILCQLACDEDDSEDGVLALVLKAGAVGGAAAATLTIDQTPPAPAAPAPAPPSCALPLHEQYTNSGAPAGTVSHHLSQIDEPTSS